MKSIRKCGNHFCKLKSTIPFPQSTATSFATNLRIQWWWHFDNFHKSISFISFHSSWRWDPGKCLNRIYSYLPGSVIRNWNQWSLDGLWFFNWKFGFSVRALYERLCSATLVFVHCKYVQCAQVYWLNCAQCTPHTDGFSSVNVNITYRSGHIQNTAVHIV